MFGDNFEKKDIMIILFRNSLAIKGFKKQLKYNK